MHVSSHITWSHKDEFFETLICGRACQLFICCKLTAASSGKTWSAFSYIKYINLVLTGMKWGLTDTDLWPCGEIQMMSHIVETCPLTNWMAAYLGYTLWMKTLFPDWLIMVYDMHTRRRINLAISPQQLPWDVKLCEITKFTVPSLSALVWVAL